ncbi:MAG TPA: amino acid adenylation domain-containing protein [Thermoanaerobaculia bacterium]|jgi:amino acid adenylation domain-containing protein/non-ribosomal peptide synthase protein (TIGR01720 family)
MAEPLWTEDETPRRRQLRDRLQSLFAELFGVPAGQVALDATFLEMGADSLFLLRASQQIQERLGAKVPFRRLMEELSTIDALAAHLAPEDTEPVAVPHLAPPPPPPLPDDLRSIFAEQLRVMERQIEMLATRGRAPAPPLRLAPPPRPAFVPFQPLDRSERSGSTELSPRQREHLDGLIARLSARTRGSKEKAQADRRALANSRATAGFRLLWKELIYPLVAHRAAGSRLWDVDGHEYVDLTMGFGALLFGHSPDFLQAALREQLDLGVQIGPESATAGEAAALISELTGAERVTFCNSGTEAVMNALRIARAITGRPRIALFAGSYHGTFDGILARGALGSDGRLRPVPAAPGVPASLIADVLVLDWEGLDSLSVVEAHAGELAAVLVEPLQSRRPDLENAELLRRLRELTRDHGITLIFDEVVTGFRMHPGGIQALFGVEADLVTYGKAVANGLPIGVVAGKAAWMDAVDGGDWRYGDRSLPEADTTFFSGTFFRHPLVMAAAVAVLRKLKASPGLQEELGRRAARLGGALDALFAAAGLAARTVRFGSLLAFRFPRDWPWADLFFFHLLEKGIYIWERRLCYLSTAHTEEDLQRVVEAVRETLRDLARGGFLAAAKEPDRRPLTEAQREIWALAQLGEAASVAYNLSLSLRLRGPLRRDALARAVQGVVDRHEALRATIDPLGETQTFAPHLAVELAWTDAGVENLDALLETEARRPFDLARGPLVRARLIRLEDELHALALTVHHIVADARSLGVLLNEIARLYGAEISAEPARLPAPTSYGRWAAETAARQQGPEMERLEAFWLARLAPPLPSLELPADHPRPPVRTYAGDRHSRRLDPALAADLKRLAGRSGATLFTLLLAGFEALLHRLAGQDDLIVGIPTVSPPAGGPLVGYCISFLPLRARLQEDSTFAGLVQATRTEVLDAYEHQGYPFSRLVRKLGIAADPGRPPLLSTTFNLDRFAGLALPGLAVELAENPTRSAPFDVEWNAAEGPDGLTLDCIYSTDLFEPATIGRWQEHLANLLAGAAASPDLALGDLPLLGDAERRQILQGWNATAAPFPREALIHELIAGRAARAPAATAAIFRDEVLTYGELDRRSNQLAHHLLALGLRPETLVGLCAERSLELAIALLGILKAGGAYLPLDPAYPRERLATLIADAGIGMLVIQERLLDRLPPHQAPTVLLDADAEAIGRRPDGDPGRRTAAEGLAYAIYTSGSTGRPKGVLVPHRPLVNYSLEMVRCFELTPEDRVLQFASISFDVMVEEVFPTWLAGAAVVLPEADLLLSTTDFQRALVRHGITVVELPTAFWREWVTDLAATGSAAPESLRLLIVGGEKPSPDAVAAWARLGVPLLNIFGLTETTVTSSLHRVRLEGTDEDLEPPIGRPMANTTYYVLDRRGRPTPVGVPGELWIGGEGLARGYHRRPDLTAERFLPDPFGGAPGARLYRTGDLARHRPDGDVDHLGRVDHQVKVRGFRVELQEIESHLAALSEVRDAAVVAQPGPGGNRLIAYVVPRDGQGIDAAGLRRTLGDRLPAHMVPALFVTLDAMPWTASGKVDRRALPEPEPAVLDAHRPFEPPRTPAERTLADLWRQILRVQRVGLADRFFELGGDSILALQVLARARRAGLALSPRRVLEDPPLSELAEGAEALIVEPATASPEAGEIPLTPSQRWLLELAAVDPHHWNMSLLRRATPFVPAALAGAAAICLERHDSLRLRFERSGDVWRQHHAPTGGPAPFTLVDLSGLPEAERLAAIERAAEELQGSLDLARGPLARFAAFDAGDDGPGEPGRLLAIAHQLVVDFVSWGILAEDLETAYDALLQGREPRLPARTTSWAEWARRLDEYAQGDDLHEELRYWLDDTRRRPLRLPLDHPAGINLESTAREVALSLPPDETRRLLGGTPAAQVRDLLLAAAALAVSGWTGEPRLRVDLEGHGREPLFDGVDLSRTVGWFGSRYPLLLDLSGVTDPGEARERVRQQLREVPRRGIGFGLLRHLSRRSGVAAALAALPVAEVGFSYQGRLASPSEGPARLTRAGDPRRASRSARALRHHVLEIESYATGGRLEVILQYSEALHRRSTIEALARRFEEALRRLP